MRHYLRNHEAAIEILQCIHRQRHRFLGVKHIRSYAASTKHFNPSSLQYNRDTGILSSSLDDGSRPLFQTVIGIEIHAQLSTPTKLFSNGRTKHLHKNNDKDTTWFPPNTALDLHDIAYPGTLPVLSKSAVESALIACAALECDIPPVSRFERKHYHYADLPLGYQVTQQRWPLARNGVLRCRRFTPQEKTKQKRKRKRKGQTKAGMKVEEEEEEEMVLSKFLSVGIDRIQLEQDTGKTTKNTCTHEDGSNTISYIDFNRAGSSLIEIVFLPHIKSAHEAASVVSTLQSLLQYLNVCDGKMEEGSLRCDLNISIAPTDPTSHNLECVPSHDEEDGPFSQHLPPGVGNRVEVKNLNSLRQIIQATEYEAIQQASDRLEGRKVSQETKTFIPRSGETETIRKKGGAVDYRFLPEPDLPPLRISHVFKGSNLDEFLEVHLPDLPEVVVERFIKEYGILEKVALVLSVDREIIQFYEDAVKHCVQTLDSGNGGSMEFQTVSMNVANWMCNDLFALLKEDSEDEEMSLENSNVCALNFGSLVALVLMEHVSTTQGKQILKIMQKERTNQTPIEIAQDKGLKLIKNMEELKALCEAVVLDPAHEKQLGQYRQGGKHLRKMAKFFAGKVMAKSKGNAHPKLMQDILGKVLEEAASV